MPWRADRERREHEVANPVASRRPGRNAVAGEYYCGPGGCPGDPTHVWTTKFVSILATLASPGAVSTTWTSSFQTYDHPHNYAITAWAIDRNGERDPTNANVHPICVRDAKSGCYS
jgi:hypothetical protein